MKFFVLLLTTFLTVNKAFGQIRFSQFYSSPILINPATTGRFNKNTRVGGVFRSEKNAQEHLFTQSTFFFDSKILSSVIPENDCFAIGIVGLSEKAMSEGIKNTYLSLSMAYQKGLDEEGKQQIGLGFQTTFARRRLEKPALLFENQIVSWMNSGYSNIDIFQFGNADFSYTDVNAGLIYQGIINTKSFISVGASMYHITKPSRIFLGGEFNLPRQIWSHVALEKNLENNKKIYTAFLIGFSNQSVNDIITGVTYQLQINKSNQFSFGAWLRKNIIMGNSIIPKIGLNFKSFMLATSYDINISSNSTSNKGASELSLIYTHAKTKEKILENRFIKF
jgi:type IX secretion system PorP/SprF family membrane protein